MQVYLNGQYLDQTEATVSVIDRGFIFGDGLYEVIRSINGNLFREKEHLDRLNEGLSGMRIKLPANLFNSLSEISRKLLFQNKLMEGEATIYIQITRGAAYPRTHTFPEPNVDPTVYVSADTFTPHTRLHQRGVDAITVSDLRWMRCNLKTVQLLPNVLARQQAWDAGVNNALMIRDGVVTESPNANIFAAKDGTLFTFPISNYILNGITRGVVLEICKELQLPVVHQPVREEELYELDELFFTGSTTDIQPVIEINGKKLNGGKPGPIVRKIQEAYQQRLYASVEKKK